MHPPKIVDRPGQYFCLGSANLEAVMTVHRPVRSENLSHLWGNYSRQTLHQTSTDLPPPTPPCGVFHICTRLECPLQGVGDRYVDVWCGCRRYKPWYGRQTQRIVADGSNGAERCYGLAPAPWQELPRRETSELLQGLRIFLKVYSRNVFHWLTQSNEASESRFTLGLLAGGVHQEEIFLLLPDACKPIPLVSRSTQAPIRGHKNGSGRPSSFGAF